MADRIQVDKDFARHEILQYLSTMCQFHIYTFVFPPCLLSILSIVSVRVR